MADTWFRQLGAGISPLRSVFNPGPAMCDFWWTEWQCKRLFSEYFCFPLSVSFRQFSRLIFVCLLLLSDGAAGEVGIPSNKAAAAVLSG